MNEDPVRRPRSARSRSINKSALEDDANSPKRPVLGNSIDLAGAEGAYQDPELGVLLVHGIGHQKRGETLLWVGDPMFEWLKNWYERGRGNPMVDKHPEPKVYLTDTQPVNGSLIETGPPPSSRLWFRQADEPRRDDPNWVLAESYWAEVFMPPTYTELIVWGLGIAPLLVERTGPLIMNRLFGAMREQLANITTAKQGAFWSLLVWGQRMTVNVAAYVMAAVGYFLLVLLGSLAQVLIVALLLLGFFLPLRNFVVQVQLSLAGWLGDAYLVAASPVRYSAMVSQVRRDIDWLRNPQSDRGGCKAVAVVAHSGGTILAHEALTGSVSEQNGQDEKPTLLITYGSGHSKEDTIQQLYPKVGFLFAFSQLARVSWAVALVILAVLLLIQPFPDMPSSVLYWSALVGLIVQATLLIVSGKLVKKYATKAFRPSKPERLDWVDYIALADIVTDDRIQPSYDAKDVKKGPKFISEYIDNLHSLKNDHGGYWQNKTQFMPKVVDRLFEQAGRTDAITPEERTRIFPEAEERHKNRVMGYFGAGLISLWSAPLLLLSLGPLLGLIGNPLRDFVIDTLQSLLGNSNSSKSSIQGSFWNPVDIWNTIIGSVIVLLVLFLWHKQVLFRLWGWWTKQEEEAMFRRDLTVSHEGRLAWIRDLFFAVRPRLSKENEAVELRSYVAKGRARLLTRMRAPWLAFLSQHSKEAKLRKDASAELKSAAAWFLAASSLLPVVAGTTAILTAMAYQVTGMTYVLLVLCALTFIGRLVWVSIAWQRLYRYHTGIAEDVTKVDTERIAGVVQA